MSEEMNKDALSLTPEEMEQRIKESPYLITKEDGQNFPIPDLIGAERLILVDGQTPAPSEELTFGICSFAPRTSLHKKHSHVGCEEIMYILSGKGIGGVGDIETEQRAGDTIFAPKGVEHWFYNPFDEPLVMLWIYTKASLREAGYALESRGYKEIDHEKEYKEIK